VIATARVITGRARGRDRDSSLRTTPLGPRISFGNFLFAHVSARAATENRVARSRASD
jgi:hypothetical protein